KGLTILFSAHQMNMVEELCDSILMINQGQEVLKGDLREIKKSYDIYNVNLHYRGEKNLNILRNVSGFEFIKEEPGFIQGTYSGERKVNDLVREISGCFELDSISMETPPLHDIFINEVEKRGEEVEQN
ncbi:MAG: DUF4162 domain-containing protein, partial [bacterium]